MKAFFLLTVLWLTAGAFAQQPKALNRFDSLVNVYKSAGFHGVILVADKDRIIYEKGYGLANFEKKYPTHPKLFLKLNR